MLLEVLLVLLLVAAVAATLLTFLVGGKKNAKSEAAEAQVDVDNPQRNI